MDTEMIIIINAMGHSLIYSFSPGQSHGKSHAYLRNAGHKARKHPGGNVTQTASNFEIDRLKQQKAILGSTPVSQEQKSEVQIHLQ